MARFTCCRACPTRLPASAFAAGGSAAISRFASASGERSPAWARRTALSVVEVGSGGDGGERVGDRRLNRLGESGFDGDRIELLVGCRHPVSVVSRPRNPRIRRTGRPVAFRQRHLHDASGVNTLTGNYGRSAEVSP